MFEGLKVIELSSVLAGPLVGSFFAELGATVVKIENKSSSGDMTRQWKLTNEDSQSPISAYYCSANYGKQSIFLDLKNSIDHAQVIDHIKEADIVLVNFKSGTAERLGLDYETLHSNNEGLIYAELTGFGTADDRPAFDVVLQAESGFMYMNGEADGKPVKMPVALIDILAAHHLKEAILCALIRKSKSGKGDKICISLYESALASLANQATNWLMADTIPQRIGSQHPNIAPYGDMFKTSDDKWIVLAVGTDGQFQALAKIMKLNTSGFETNQQRLGDRSKLNSLLSEQFCKHSASHWNQELKSNDIPFGQIKNMQEVFEDEKSQSMILEETIEGIETKRVRTALI